MGFLSFSLPRKRKPSTQQSLGPHKRNFSGFSLRPRSFFDPLSAEHQSGTSSPPSKLERAATGGGDFAPPPAFQEDLTRSLLHASKFRRDDDGEELLEPPPRRSTRRISRPFGLGERHSMLDVPCSPVEPLRKVPTLEMGLPPGAMAPAPPRIEFCADAFRPIDWEFEHAQQQQQQQQQGVQHSRSMSCPLADDMIRPNVPAPIVPPRSHLRSLSAAPSPSSSSDHSHNSRQYVLDVAPPTRDEEVEVIGFGAPKQSSQRTRPTSSQARDPFKVRDGVQPRKASSGVYTPQSFPGPSTSSLSRTTSAASATSNAASSVSLAPPTPSGRLAGLKRLSVGLLSQPQRGHINTSSISGPISAPVSSPAPAPMDSEGRRYGHSPASSTHSTASLSPPRTPTTPKQDNLRAEVQIADPHSAPAENSNNNSAGSSPTSSSPTSASFPAPPKRTRRKPVPRLDEGLVSALERLEVTKS